MAPSEVTADGCTARVYRRCVPVHDAGPWLSGGQSADTRDAPRPSAPSSHGTRMPPHQGPHRKGAGPWMLYVVR